MILINNIMHCSDSSGNTKIKSMHAFKMLSAYILKTKNKIISVNISTILIFLFPGICSAQTYFQKTYPNSPYEQEGQDVLATPDGGYLMAGYTTNSTINDCDVYLVKTDGVGNLLWTRTYGGAKPDFPYHMIETTDGNYFLIGYSQSYGGGDSDILLMKINPAGDLVWTKTFGGFGNDYGKDIIATTDGNYMIVGWSNSVGPGGQNANLIKIDPAGIVIWNKLYGGASQDYGSSVKQCSDGGYIMLGQTFSYGAGGGDAYLVKTNANGDTVWTKTFGGALADEGTYINVNADNSFTFLIRDSSNAGQDIDIRIVKTDATGNMIWSKIYGGTQKDTPKMIQPTADGGYIVGAISRSFGWINPDMWIMKFNNMGDTTWTRHFGGVNNEHCYVVREQPDGSYIATGKTASYGPDMDVILLKINSEGTFVVGMNELAKTHNNILLFPNPGEGDFQLEMGDFKAIKIRITDITGREIYEQEFKHEQKINIKLKNKIPGSYIIKCESETQSITIQFIIN